MVEDTVSHRRRAGRARDLEWVHAAVKILREEADRAVPTPLAQFPLPESWRVELLLKDESRHPTGSLKHRLARSLFLSALLNGDLSAGDTVVESSSGSTAVSEAYFARLLGLSFVAVIPSTTSPEKVRLIERQGGRAEFVKNAADAGEHARRISHQRGWYYMDQFANASIATDWRGGNIASELFAQLGRIGLAEPRWIVVGAGTGGTSATIARHCRFERLATRLCVVDPEGSAFYPAWREGRLDATAPGSRIEGIGRPRVEASFLPAVVDDMAVVPDAGSIAAMQLLHSTIGIDAGPSTGTNLFGALRVATRMRKNRERGAIVTLICDGGERYRETYGSTRWLRGAGLDPSGHRRALDALLGSPGVTSPPPTFPAAPPHIT